MVQLSKKDVNIIKPIIESARRGKYNRPPVRRRGGNIAGGGSAVRTVKTQEAWQSDGTVSVKFLDADGVEVGDAFDVYVLVAKSPTDVTSGYWPTITDDQILMVMKDREGDWIVVRPDVQQSTTCA